MKIYYASVNDQWDEIIIQVLYRNNEILRIIRIDSIYL